MQFSLFGAEAGELLLADLDGVLLGGGHWLSGAGGARLSVVVADRWRADALADAFAALGVGDAEPPRPGAAPPGRPGTAGGDGWVARTSLSPALRPLEARWRPGAVEVPPADLTLSAAGLRLWAITAGSVDEVGYLLGTPAAGDADGPGGRVHRVAGALLARTGIAAVELGVRGGPGWRVSSARRLRRLAELVGAPPAGGEADWPTLPAEPPARRFRPA